MKRTFLFCAVSILTLFVTACGAPANSRVPNPQSNVATTSGTPAVTSMNKTNTSVTKASVDQPIKTTKSNVSTSAAPSGLVPVVVSKETDGDTIHVTMPNGKDKTIRMLLIDTPEDVKPGTPVEPFSLAAAHYAAQVMPVGKHIYLQEGVPGHQLDKYGRLLAFVYVTKTDMYNEDVVKKGLARVAYIYPPNTQHLSTLEADQSYAKAHHLGIWTIPGYVTSHGYNMAAVKSSSKTTSKPPPAPMNKTSSTTLSLVSFTQNVTPGSYATITIHAIPSTTADIEVDYKSGPSHAHGLVSETVGSNGEVSWTWKVGTRTTPGNWPVIITDAGKTLTETLHVS